MNTKRNISFRTLFILSIVLIIALAGCSSSSKSDSTTEPAKTSDTASTDATTTEGSTTEQADAEVQYPITIKHAFGETVIEKKPERVATISWANHDVALALGVVPVGFSAANYGVEDGSGMLPWTAAKLKELGADTPNIFQDTDGLDYEKISDAQPDVILAAYSGITKEEYETLSQIAPVIAYQSQPWVTSWREQVEFNSKGMGMEKEGQQLIKDTEKLIADKAAEHPSIKGKKAVFAYISPQDLSSVSIYTPGDPRGEFLEEIGMVFPDSVKNLVKEDSGFYLQLSAENADVLNDADIIVSYADDAVLKTLQADPVFGKIPAIKRGSVVFIKDGTPLAAAGNPNPLSIAYTIDEYLGLIDAAVAKING
ncbi:iron complex transport system substrate-binding protein [Paenibacillus cellulosilyticus]|uniref:Iron complex transport system substrate-binding protein n=1 Tax=Paenibacillus cellulosilyticus TaxID=375489 RepID=A0A2V2YXD3_9BACL|nr:iron-siderophore ABC transporter substrate-binding protein [Paenibacillus cellulosilyticus]PWV97273.1 iron complex transport system substrate-binding protein [Paenibacillus cellulosilyticus]QKS47520.1 iron-siderophore ABC transporter substrate-binding protein [Paenibacillus cellulosilyticus]